VVLTQALVEVLVLVSWGGTPSGLPGEVLIFDLNCHSFTLGVASAAIPAAFEWLRLDLIVMKESPYTQVCRG
jgi:hypothetical protein